MVDTATATGPLSSLSPSAKKWLKIGIPIAVVIALIFFGFTRYNGTRNGLIDRETTLNAQYQANQAELDAFVKKINEEFQVAGAKTGALDKVLTDAVRGLYDKSLATPGKPVTSGQTTPLISALVQAYPDLGGLDIYDRIVTEISAGRENFKQVQVKLLDQIRSYKAYRTKGIFHSMLVSAVGYPQLQARIGKAVYTGKAALDQMQLIVTSGATSQDFTSGTEAPLNLGTPTS